MDKLEVNSIYNDHYHLQRTLKLINYLKYKWQITRHYRVL